MPTGLRASSAEESKGLHRKVRTVLKAGAFMDSEASASVSSMFAPEPALLYARKQVKEMLEWADANEEYLRYAWLFLLAYVFLLRVPSEALPAVAGKVPGREAQSVLEHSGEGLRLTLRRRKNKPQGSQLVRSCWCTQCSRTCPVHALGPVVAASPPGERLFEDHAEQGKLRSETYVAADRRGKCRTLPHARPAARARARSAALRCAV